MNLDKTVKNWRWWVVLPIALPIVVVISIPNAIIFLLELLISGVEIVNIGERSSDTSKRLVDWVHKGTYKINNKD